MIISRTPLRISFAGGGSDIGAYYRHEPGAVVTAAINKYIYIMVTKQFDGRIIAQYSTMEVTRNISDVRNNLIREALRITGVDGGVHITSVGDVPSEGTGMGSSSAYLVGLLNALYAHVGIRASAKRLAQEACHIEIEILKKPIGKQDQYIAAYGGLQYIRFLPDDRVLMHPVPCSDATKKKLQRNLLLLYTGLTRPADPILTVQKKNLEERKETREAMGEMVKIASTLGSNLRNNSLRDFGRLLHKNWILKKSMTESVSTKQIDAWYETARKHGATGGKVLGAGGGGFLLVYADARHHQRIRESVPGLLPLPFEFEPEGSKILYHG